ncbi:DUF488 family protein [Rhodoblastus sp.]|jgi:uncharacterized protein YeaO (DUF488 family)|uniref:DUF488 domain-containing protein n=1 Tax=Rhodoblastus sp. TaxID=1962975 RepID=UPI0025E4DEC8|nr:DUF488 family protein [Rhodoblastus sp.]
MSLRLKRAYLPPAPADGQRVLVDRLWPRNLRKDDAAIDLWLKEVAPGAGLRRWFGHDQGRWNEFRRRYQLELAERSDVLRDLAGTARGGELTLIYAARDELHNHALILGEAVARVLNE